MSWKDSRRKDSPWISESRRMSCDTGIFFVFLPEFHLPFKPARSNRNLDGFLLIVGGAAWRPSLAAAVTGTTTCGACGVSALAAASMIVLATTRGSPAWAAPFRLTT